MKSLSFLIISILILFSCQRRTEEKKVGADLIHQIPQITTDEKNFESYFIIDSSLIKRDSVNIIKISNKEKDEKLLAICNCEKNKDNNTIKIQITSAIPTKTELENGEKGSRVFMDLGNPGSFKGQLKTLTFHLKDSVIKGIDFISKSTDKDYEALGYEYMNVQKHEIKISKMNYSVASNVFGTYKLILPKEYGYLKNDTSISGTFECNNWRVNTLEDLKVLDLNKWNEQKRRNMGFQVNE